METPAKKKAMTTKFTGFIGLCLFLWLVYLFIDSGFVLWSTSILVARGERTLFADGATLYSIVVAASAGFAVLSAACLVLFWTKRLFARRLLTVLLGLVIVFRIFEVFLAFLPEVTKVAGPSAALLESIVVKMLLGVIVPSLFFVYLVRPERTIEIGGAGPERPPE